MESVLIPVDGQAKALAAPWPARPLAAGYAPVVHVCARGNGRTVRGSPGRYIMLPRQPWQFKQWEACPRIPAWRLCAPACCPCHQGGLRLACLCVACRAMGILLRTYQEYAVSAPAFTRPVRAGVHTLAAPHRGNRCGSGHPQGLWRIAGAAGMPVLPHASQK